MREHSALRRSRLARYVALVATVAALPAALPSSTAAQPLGVAATARIQLAGHPALAGLDPSALRAVSVVRALSGHRLVRFQQRVGGVPVVAGQLVAVLDAAGSLVTVTGEISVGTVTRSYDVTASAAARTARRAVARATGTARSDLRVARPARALYDASLVDPGGRPGARAVWSVRVRGERDLGLRQRVLVDAVTGAVALRVSEARALDRAVCDNGEQPGADEFCRPDRYARVEGQGPTGVTDVDAAYDLTGSTADWFASRLGVDLTALIGSDEGDGRKLRSTTRYCGPEGCPFDNAFWNGDQMVYGTGFAGADDVVAHELGHGVTQQAAGLVYWFQSGAIDESMSDVFGELVDLSNALGNDAPEVRWVLGEDLPAGVEGATRDLADPPSHQQPDSTSSPYFDPSPDYEDYGGVHVNSGVPNKTAYLISDGTAAEPGGSFGGQSFPGIGEDRTGVLYWSALRLLTPGADFADLAGALDAACAALAGAATAGMTAEHCATVRAATVSTGLARWFGPGQPQSVRVSTGVSSVQVRWRPPLEGAGDLTSYVVWIRPTTRWGEDFSPIEPTSTRAVLRGLRAGVDHTVGVLAVSSEGTSASVVRRLRGSRLEVRWPDELTYGEALHAKGTLRDARGTGLADRPVALLRYDRDGGRYGLLAEGTTAADGTFRLRARVRATGQFVVLFGGGRRMLGDRSAVQLVRVRRVVDLAPVRSVRPGGPLVFRGWVRPGAWGGEVRLQTREAAGGWRTVLRGALGADGRFELLAPRGADAGSRWRVRAPGRDGVDAGVSRVVEVP